MLYDREILSDPVSYEMLLGMTAEEIWRESRARGMSATAYVRQLWRERHGDRPLPNDVLYAWIRHIRKTCRDLGMDVTSHVCLVCGRPLQLDWTPEHMGD